MDDRPPPSPDPTAPALEDPLHALAAGALDEARSKDLRRKIGRDPALARRLDALETLEAALRSEPLLDLPAGLEATLRWAPAPEAPTPWWVGTARAAAGILAAFTAWILATGALPTRAMAAPSPVIGEALAHARSLLPEPPLLPLASAPPPLDGLSPLLLAGAGLLCLALGLGLARLFLSPASEGSPS